MIDADLSDSDLQLKPHTLTTTYYFESVFWSPTLTCPRWPLDDRRSSMDLTRVRRGELKTPRVASRRISLRRKKTCQPQATSGIYSDAKVRES